MTEYLVHLATVITLAMGVVPLRVLISFGGLRDLRDAVSVRGVIGALLMAGMGLLLIGLSLFFLVEGVVK